MKPGRLFFAVVALAIALTLCSCGPFGLLPLAGVGLGTSKSKDDSDEFQLTVMIDPSDGGWVDAYVGAGMVGPNGMFAPGTIVSLTAMPASGMGYNFSHWSGDVRNRNNDTAEVLMDGPRTVTAHFGINQVGLIVDAGGMGNPTPSEGIAQFSIGTSVSCTVDSYVGDPNPTRYKCVGWDGTGSVPATGSTYNTGPFTINVASTITWLWQTQHEVTSDVNDPAMGSVSITGGNPDGDYYPDCDTVTLDAIPNASYILEYWEVDGNFYSDSNLVSLDIDEPKDVVAFFRTVTATDVLLDVDSGGLGNPNPPEGGHYYTIDESVTCTVDPYVNVASPTRSRCIGWIGTGNVPISDSTNDTGAFNINVDSSIYWEWGTQHEVTISENDPARGSATVSGGSPDGNYYPDLDIVTISATPMGAYLFDHWEVNGTDIGSSNPETLTVDAPQDVLAVFRSSSAAQVDLTVDSGGMGNASPAQGIHTYDEGTVISCTVDAYANQASPTRYKCAGWTGTGDVTISGTTNDTGTFTIFANSSITWNWQTQYEVTVDVNDPARGSATVSGGNPDGAYYPDLDTMTIEATATGTYLFDHWQVNGTDMGPNNPETLNIDEPKDVIAVFRSPAPTLVDLTVDSGGMGNASPLDGTDTYDEGTSVRCTVDAYVDQTSPTRSKCVGWTGTGDVASTGTTNDTGTFTIFADSSITWNWQTQHELTIDVNDLAWGSATVSGGNPDGNYYPDLDTMTIHATPIGTYLFDHWEVNGTDIGSSNPETLNIDMPKDVVAIFTIPVPVQVDLTVDSAGMGNASPLEGTNIYDEGTSLVCTVDAYVGPVNPTRSKCIGWTGTGDVPGSGTTSNTGSFVINQDSSITWLWQTQHELILNVNDPVRGSATVSGGNPDGTYFSDLDTVTIQATQIGTYIFDHWEVNGTGIGSSNPETLNIDAPKDVLAVFRSPGPAQVDLIVDSGGMGNASPLDGTYTYDEGTSLSCTVDAYVDQTSPTRYKCAGWTGTGDVPSSGSTNDTGTFTIFADSTITWNWQMQHEVTSTVNNATWGSASLSGGSPDGGYYSDLDSVTLLASSNSGYAFDYWEVNGGSYSTANPVSLAIDGPKDIEAYFVEEVTLTVNASGRDAPNPPEGANTYIKGDSLSCTLSSYADPSSPTRYRCIGWTGTGAVPGSGGTNNTGIFTIDIDSSITWNWQTQHEVTSSVNDGIMGSVSVTGGSPDGAYYPSADSVTLAASSNSGYILDYWLINSINQGSSPTMGLTINEPKDIVANFRAVVPSTADFTANVTSGIVPLSVSFTDNSTGDVTSWVWDFGDGGTGFVQNPVYSYTLPGTYTVTLTVNGPGGSDQNIKTNYITVGDQVEGFETGDLSNFPWSTGGDGTWSVTNAESSTGTYSAKAGTITDSESTYIEVTLTVQAGYINFYRKVSSESVFDELIFFIDSIQQDSWSGDIGWAQFSYPVAAGTHTFTWMYAKDASLSEYSDTAWIDDINVSPVPPPPTADFTASPTSGDAPLDVNFADTSTGLVTAWSWDFGDTWTSTLQNPAHTYINPGTYGVSLTVAGPGGSDGITKTSYITVTEPVPVADFTASPTTGSTPLLANFTDLSTGTITSWTWDFDSDGTTDSTQQNPIYTYNNAGNFTVTLAISGPGGSDNNVKSAYIRVYDGNVYVATTGDDANYGTWPGDAVKTIQRGIDLAQNTWTVLVADGTYQGVGNRDIDTLGKSITVKSQNGVASCTIDCQSSGRGFYIHLGEGLTTVIEGFSIQNGAITGGGAGIFCSGASPTIRSCVIVYCLATTTGGGISCENGASPYISHCVSAWNNALQGAGIFAADASPTIDNCLIINNTSSSYGGGIYFNSNNNSVVTNCTISQNQASDGGGVAAWQAVTAPTLRNCIIWGNTAGNGNELLSTSAPMTVEYCCFDFSGVSDSGSNIIYSGWNIGLDPQFRNPSGGDYRLKPGSQCFDSGNSALVSWSYDLDGNPRIDGLNVDMGAWELNVLRVPSEYATIGNALNSANMWDVVLVADGLYYETNLSFFGNTIAVLSENGAAYTTIDCDWNGRAFYFGNGETRDCVLDGFHIRNGDVTPTADWGGGIYCWNASPTIANCLIENCMANYGGGISVSQGNPTIFNCTLMMNMADMVSGWGGGIYCTESDAEILNCVIANNNAGYGGAIIGGSWSNLTITNSTFTWNNANEDGGTLYCGGSSSMVVTNSILWDNWAGMAGNEVYVALGSSVTMNYSCYDNRSNDINALGAFTSTACINENPIFRDPGFWDFRLGPASPCLDMGDDSVVTWMQDSDGSKRIMGRYVDMGAYELFVLRVPSEYTTIADAINDAWDWDVVLVANGTYNETELNFGGMSIAVRSENGPSACIIDCQISGRAFYFGNGETNQAAVVGLTITNGSSNFGGAIYCVNSSPMIAECNLTWNMADQGGAIYFSNTNAMVRSCIIRNNQAFNTTGGGIHCAGNAFVTIANCLISNNLATMYGGGIAIYNGSSVEITNCTITNNVATNSFGGGIYAVSADYWLYNSIFWNNFSPAGGREIHLFDFPAGAQLYNCCYTPGGTAGPGFYYFDPTCTTGNPNFVFPGGAGPGGGGDFHLMFGPCVDTGDDMYAEWANLIYDLDGNTRYWGPVDMGAYEW